MHALDALIARHGGAIATHELHQAGVPRGRIAAAVRDRRLWRVRQGWYVSPGTRTSLVRAVRVGGRATCATALACAGVWTVHDDRLHVRVESNDCRLRSPTTSSARLNSTPRPDVVVHWRAAAASESRLLCDVADSLDDLRQCAPRLDYLAALESSIRIRPDLTRALVARGHSDIGSLVDGICESGIETMCWVRLLAGLGARRQVHIDGVGRVDFLVGERLVIEVDGASYHQGVTPFEEDRRRDAELSRRGFRVLRFSYRQIMHDWKLVEAAVWAALARGDHR
jgi:very-short-patch-repair endonuclease